MTNYPDFKLPSENLFFGDGRKVIEDVKAYLQKKQLSNEEKQAFVYDVLNVFLFSLETKTHLNSFIIGEKSETEFVINELQNISKEKNEISGNHYPRIFKNSECFLFFVSLKNDAREQTKLADYSFIFRRMQKDGYIFKGVSDNEFRDFLSEYTSVVIGKTKGLAYCTTIPKENNYITTKRLFKLL